MKLMLQSFGHKYGLPEADVVFDVRCLDNPFWVSELKPMSGLDAPVREYIFSNQDSVDYARKIAELLKTQVRLAAKRGCEQLRIAVGCTGGRHRSVAVTEFLAQELHEHEIKVEHRDIGRG